jgi:hypothetical protein
MYELFLDILIYSPLLLIGLALIGYYKTKDL